MDNKSSYKPVKLLFPGEDGKYYAEYVPPKMNFVSKKLCHYRLMYAFKHNKPFYYWYYNHLLTPVERKVIDINFIGHVFKDHTEANPLGIKEWNYYRKIYPSYAKEYEQIAAEDKKTWRKPKHNKKILLQQDPYIKAYKKHWIDTFTFDPNFKTLYHGAELSEALEVLNKIKDDIDEEFNARAQKVGADKKEYTESYSNPSPNQTSSQKEKDTSSIETNNGFKIIFWASDIIISFVAIINFIANDADDLSFIGMLGASLAIIAFLQIFFLVPYFLIFIILKTRSWLMGQVKTKNTNLETDHESESKE